VGRTPSSALRSHQLITKVTGRIARSSIVNPHTELPVWSYLKHGFSIDTPPTLTRARPLARDIYVSDNRRWSIQYFNEYQQPPSRARGG